jgi:uncharacterized membrane protein YjjP (DUF1212 family)
MPVPPEDRARQWLRELPTGSAPAPADHEATGVDATIVRATSAELILQLGEAMTRAGESVDGVQTRMERMAAAYGLRDVEVIAMPTMLLVQTMSGVVARVRLRRVPPAALRVDQIAAIYRLVESVERGRVGPASGLGELWDVLAAPPPYRRLVRIPGYGVLSVGFSLVLQPSVLGVVAAFILGCFVGVLTMAPITALRTVLPVLAAFVVSLMVFGLQGHLQGENPLRIAIPPLIAFLPGAVLTTGFVELAAAQMISGASRVVYGAVTLALLAFGIVAASTLVGTPNDVVGDQQQATLGAWAPYLGILLVAVAHHLHYCAPLRMLPWILAVLLLTYVAQILGGEIFAPELGGFFGALVMTMFALALDMSGKGPPAMVTFLPGFWLLVPGAASLIGVTELVSTSGEGYGTEDFLAAVEAFVAIALGVLIGAALFDLIVSGYRAASVVPDRVQRWLHR